MMSNDGRPAQPAAGPFAAVMGPLTERAGRWSRSPGVLLAAIVAAVCAVRLPSFVHGLFDPDEASIAMQGITLRNGGTLYVDVIDRKPPIPAYLYAWFFELFDSTDLRPLHALAAVALAGSAAVLALHARQRWGTRAGWWAAILIVCGAVGFVPVDGQAANFAHFALLPGSIAIVVARRGTRPAALLAGVALGLAILCRQSWAIGVIPGLVAVWFASRRRIDLLIFAGGLVATVAAVGLFVPFDAFWYWTFTSNESYVTAGTSIGELLGSLAGSTGLFVLFHITLIAFVAYTFRRRLRALAAWRDDIDLWLWLLTGLASVLTGFRFFGHYWLQVLPPAILIAAQAVPSLRLNVRRVGATVLGTSTLVVVLLGFAPGIFRDLPDPHPLASYVERHTAPDDLVMTWGKFPELHLVADRPPGGALVHSDFVTGLTGNRPAGPETLEDAAPDAREEFMESVLRSPPVLILDTSTADLREYGAYPLASVPELAEFVDAHYRSVATVEGVRVYRLNGT